MGVRLVGRLTALALIAVVALGACTGPDSPASGAAPGAATGTAPAWSSAPGPADLAPWAPQDGTLATAEKIPCAPRSGRPTPTVFTPWQHAIPGQFELGDLTLRPPAQDAKPVTCASGALAAITRGMLMPRHTVMRIWLAIVELTIPPDADPHDGNVPYYDGDLMWVVDLEGMPMGCNPPTPTPLPCVTSPSPGRGILLVDATTGQFLTLEQT